MGDVNGIGPEIVAKTLARPEVKDVCRPLVLGSAAALDAARRFAPDCPRPRVFDRIEDVTAAADMAPVLDAGCETPALRPGTLDAAAGHCAVAWVTLGVQLAMAQTVGGLVTAPLNKAGIHRAGYTYPGHTELIAEMTGTSEYRMALFADTMRIVHVTAHLALRDALEAITENRIAASIRMGHAALVRMGLPRRRIAVAGLNPHAGEAEAFGDEETRVIAPAVEACRAEGLDCAGPFPPDTVFRRMHGGEFDLVVALYHDQGHIPLKLVAMDDGVNVTLGIPIVRTSVDHGTAYDIAGKGLARDDSLWAAIRLAAQLAGRPESAQQGTESIENH